MPRTVAAAAMCNSMASVWRPAHGVTTLTARVCAVPAIVNVQSAARDQPTRTAWPADTSARAMPASPLAMPQLTAAMPSVCPVQRCAPPQLQAAPALQLLTVTPALATKSPARASVSPVVQQAPIPIATVNASLATSCATAAMLGARAAAWSAVVSALMATVWQSVPAAPIRLAATAVAVYATINVSFVLQFQFNREMG